MNENFIEKINDIVFDTLARRCSVYIESIGSLVISSENVLTKIGGKLNSYPYYKVTLVKGDRFGIDLKAHCLSIGGIDKKNIDVIFKSWLGECGINSSLSRFIINGVVAYDSGVVKMSDGLNKSLNPLYIEPKDKEPSLKRSRANITIWIVSAVSLVIIAIAAYLILYGDRSYITMPPKIETTAVKEPVKVPVLESETIIQDTVIPEPITNSEEFYVVVGVFSTKENAEEGLESVNSSTKDIISVGGKYYSIIGRYNTEQEAITVNRKYPQNDYWVLNVKNNKPIYK